MSYKIVELQGLRCIAIVSVLFYHVWPNVFANGFLGVDIFFVISGHIMALILLPSDSLKTSFISTTLKFYHRRIYRILPLYLLNILATILIVPTISYSSSSGGIFSQVIDVLTFSKNYVNLSKKLNYFDNGLSVDMFTHYWSLCVEMQFYALAPFLLYFSKRLPLLLNLFILWPILIAGCVVLIFHKIINYGPAGAMYTFNMLPARFYEFAAGFIAYYAQEFIIKYFSDGKIKLQIRKYFYHVININILSIILMGIVFWPVRHVDIISLPFTVVITAAIITFVGKTIKSEEELKFSILAQEIFVFIGNASYSLYIFHWIFIIIYKAMLEETEQNRQIIFILSFLIGSLIHKYIEKPICNARLPWKLFLIWVTISYAIICGVAYTNDLQRNPSANAMDIYYNKSKLINDSLEWKKFALSSITPEISAELAIYSGTIRCDHYSGSEWPKTVKEAWTYGSEFKGTGNLSVLIIGNSHAECLTPGIKLAMDGLYSQLSFVAIAGVTPFEGFQYSGAWFVFQNAVKHYKPDIIFLMFKYQKDFEDPVTDTDYHTMKVQEMITFLSNHSKVVFISGGHFDVPKFYSIKFTEMIYNYGWVKDFKVKQQDVENRHAVSTKRWNGIKCENCIFIDMLKAFCKNGWCSPLDETRTIPLLFDPDHVTIFGSHLISKLVKMHLNQMFQLLTNTHM